MLLDIAEEAVQLEAFERLPEGVDLDTLRKPPQGLASSALEHLKRSGYSFVSRWERAKLVSPL